MIAAAAVPVRQERDSVALRPQLVVPPRRPISAPAAPMLVGDRAVRLFGGGPVSGRVLSRVAANIGGAVEAVDAFWGVDWPREISVVAAGSDEEFRAAAGGGPEAQWADIAAVTVVDHVDPAHRVAIGQRIVFAPGAANMSEPAFRIVLTHELFHYAARGDTALDAPRWLTEGVADFVGRPSTSKPEDALTIALTLPSDADLDTPGPQRSLGYDRAWWFARFVADVYGAPKLRAFYLAACGVGHGDLASAIHGVLGTDYGGLFARWKQWMLP
ncbi:hypothetical protein [Mycobacterium sp. 852002-51057_SCH5723018]|uniref:hypothetical protein n=1 Tax=Mycobacterium sp. 852002-51057_SCH5723018 TaxID=1834094 RepID=UPI0007FE3ABC|nr:hypothetical protein A5764_22445 [Mycobacterium sp. 852002-51057_SCH5723018]